LIRKALDQEQQQRECEMTRTARRFLGTAQWAGLLTVAFLANGADISAASSFGGGSHASSVSSAAISSAVNSAASSATSSAVQSVIQSQRDEIMRNARSGRRAAAHHETRHDNWRNARAQYVAPRGQMQVAYGKDHTHNGD
jgi:hypothetical protein